MKILEVLTQKRLTGNLGERAAARYLFFKGYRILKRNFVAMNHEIDIIARKGRTTAFVEVKTRNVKSLGSTEPRPASAVTPEKQLKIIKAANYYKTHNNFNTRMRFDIIEVYIESSTGKQKIKDIKHLIGAFDMDTARRADFKKYKNT